MHSRREPQRRGDIIPRLSVVNVLSCRWAGAFIQVPNTLWHAPSPSAVGG